MMYFLLGVVVGFLNVMFVFIFLAAFEKPIRTIVRRAYNEIPKVKEKGGIIQAESDVAITRRKIIEDNKKAGRDTPLSDIIVN